ncbi:hypothetical protein SK128_013105 [Halocaridina rubra]|uniref:Secreted protein n=1 Tax=Halocaridina rubra TaxID=373956 RepID=A0AAN8WJB7_HALRR
MVLKCHFWILGLLCTLVVLHLVCGYRYGHEGTKEEEEDGNRIIKRGNSNKKVRKVDIGKWEVKKDKQINPEDNERDLRSVTYGKWRYKVTETRRRGSYRGSGTPPPGWIYQNANRGASVTSGTSATGHRRVTTTQTTYPEGADRVRVGWVPGGLGGESVLQGRRRPTRPSPTAGGTAGGTPRGTDATYTSTTGIGSTRYTEKFKNWRGLVHGRDSTRVFLKEASSMLQEDKGGNAHNGVKSMAWLVPISVERVGALRVGEDALRVVEESPVYRMGAHFIRERCALCQGERRPFLSALCMEE